MSSQNTYTQKQREEEEKKTIQRPSLCLADGEAILWQKWDHRSPCSLAIVFCPDLPCSKAFPQMCISLPATFVREWGRHFDNPLGDLCPGVFSRRRNGHFAARSPLPLPSRPPPFLLSMPLFVRSCNSLQFEQFHILPVSPCSSHHCLQRQNTSV